ncbi:MAG: hypothetical protein NC548_38780 [Lachnospiraceae bacterium]|nr:hypothetical protein [Lachnospiraceae bacterium]
MRSDNGKTNTTAGAEGSVEAMENLTTKEYAELRGCTVRYVRKFVTDGRIKANEVRGSGGTAGVSYLIPLANIEPGLQRKYLRRKARREAAEEKREAEPASVDLELFTKEERAEMALWKSILADWVMYREDYRDRAGEKNKAEADEKYVGYLSGRYPEMKFS